MMRLWQLSVLCLAISIGGRAWAQQRQVPDSLFGVKLGGIHVPGATEGAKGTFPVSEFKGANQFLGVGVHYYFKPLKEYSAFPYVEKRKTPEDKYFETSYRLYILPILPSNVLNERELRFESVKWEVALIEWSDKDTKDNAYYWAQDFCRTLEVDLGRKAKTLDDYATRIFQCTFTQDGRELSAQSLGDLKLFTLRMPHEVLENKSNAVDAIYRKLRMNAIRPY